MNSLNQVQLIGNVTKDIEIKILQNGQSVASVGVATNRLVKRGETWEDVPEFHTVILWGKMAELAGKYLRKGQKIFFKGRLQTSTWENKEGQKQYKTEVIAEDMIFLGSLPKGSLAEKAQEVFPDSTVEDSKPE